MTSRSKNEGGRARALLARLLHTLEFRLRVWRCMLLGHHKRIERPAAVMKNLKGDWYRMQSWICEGTCGVHLMKSERVDAPDEVS